MISSIIVFVLAFAALGLLLGYAAILEPQSNHQALGKVGASSNGTVVPLNDKVSVQLQPSK